MPIEASSYVRRLTGGQCNITPGLGEPGRNNAVVLVMTELVPPGLPRQELLYISGAGVGGQPKVVATALHVLASAIRVITGNVLGHLGVEVWAILAHDFDLYQRTHSSQEDLDELINRGAVQALGFFSCIDQDHMTGHYSDGEDFGLVVLEKELMLPQHQPYIPSQSEAAFLASYLYGPTDEPDARIRLVMEGLGTHFTVDFEVDYEWDPWSMVIQWIEAALGTWMFTGTHVAPAAELGLHIADAVASLGNGPIYGHVDLPGIFVPEGFSGGGAYLKVPAAALGPNDDDDNDADDGVDADDAADADSPGNK
jgi:hypothetical protein